MAPNNRLIGNNKLPLRHPGISNLRVKTGSDLSPAKELHKKLTEWLRAQRIDIGKRQAGELEKKRIPRSNLDFKIPEIKIQNCPVGA